MSLLDEFERWQGRPDDTRGAKFVVYYLAFDSKTKKQRGSPREALFATLREAIESALSELRIAGDHNSLAASIEFGQTGVWPAKDVLQAAVENITTGKEEARVLQDGGVTAYTPAARRACDAMMGRTAHNESAKEAREQAQKAALKPDRKATSRKIKPKEKPARGPTPKNAEKRGNVKKRSTRSIEMDKIERFGQFLAARRDAGEEEEDRELIEVYARQLGFNDKELQRLLEDLG